MAAARTLKLTTDLLQAYANAAFSNADELLAEATLLLDHGYMARAYFLAVSSIEESGKALQAYDAQLRNLKDPAVCKQLIMGLESHRLKTNYALSRWALNSPDTRAALEKALELISHLTHGREPSMYSDLRTDPVRVQTPREVVRNEAAKDCVRLAKNCLANVHRHLSEEKPVKTTSAQDRLFVMKSQKLQDVLNLEDFWWYFISRLEAGKSDFAEAVISYERECIKTGKPFQNKREPKTE